MENQNSGTGTSNAVGNDEKESSYRPKDARLIHALLTAQGVSAYQERVPLMLADFAYRYTRSVLTDAAALTADGYGAQPSGGGRGSTHEEATMPALRMAVASRQIAQFQPDLPKEALLELAQETNRAGLPRIERDFGLRLPDEKYLLSGVGFSLQEQWDDEEDEEEDEDDDEANGENGDKNEDDMMKDGDGADGDALDNEDMDEDEFEEVMGVSQDKQMTDA